VPKLKLLLLGCGVTAALVGVFWLARTRAEPRYAHRSLWEWLQRSYSHPGTNETDVAEATHAIREIGTNALPYLLEGVRFQPSSWKSNAYLKVLNLPQTLQPAFILNWLAESRNKKKARDSAHLAWILNEKALPVAPELLTISYTKRSDVSWRALATFHSMGTNGYPFLLKAARDPNHPQRGSAIREIDYILHDFPDNPEIPKGLIELTSDQDFVLRRTAAAVIMHLVHYQTGGDLQKMRAHPLVLTNPEAAFVFHNAYEHTTDSMPFWIHAIH
jgi:hypothetical protein